MATDKRSAEKAFERFLAGESRFCLIEGTHQLGKLGIVMQGLMRKDPEIDRALNWLLNESVLFRTVTFDAAERELARALGTGGFNAKLRRDRGLKAARITIHIDTVDARTWTSTPDRVR